MRPILARLIRRLVTLACFAAFVPEGGAFAQTKAAAADEGNPRGVKSTQTEGTSAPRVIDRGARPDDDGQWGCGTGERARRIEGEVPRRIETFYCHQSESYHLVLGLTHRGLVSETGSFADKLGFEAALRLWSRLDLGTGVGQVFKDGARIAVDVRTRVYLVRMPSAGGPYLGGGWVVTEPRRGYVTLGLFGGAGFFYELQVRGSEQQPLAVIPSMGLRVALP